MYKEIEAGSWASLADQGIGHIVPVSSRGLTSSDRHNFFSKTAASEKFLHEMQDVKLADGEVPIHINAMGAHAWHGANRKGDSFTERTLRDRHSTFVTDGKFYAHHRNRDPKINYGKVASACYNDVMHRVELLVLANTSDTAAKKNAGLVLPTEFLDQIEKNAEIAVSMGCFIRNDECSICHNKARTTAEYCDETNCRDPKTGEWGFGCKHGLAKVAANGRMQYVDNIEPTFFDISAVGIPADRTAYGVVADYLFQGNKTASFDCSAEDYLGIQKKKEIAPTYVQSIASCLHKLADIESSFSKTENADLLLGYGFYADKSDIDLGQKIAMLSSYDRYFALRRLAENGVLLSPESFASAMSLHKTAGLDIRQSSKNIYRDTYNRYHATSFDFPASVLSQMTTAPLAKTAEWYLPLHTLSPYQLDQVKTSSLVQRGIIAYASQCPHTEIKHFRDLAESYALYKAAALCCFPNKLKDFGEKAAVLQTLYLTGLEN